MKQANLHRKGAVCADHQISVGDIVLLKEELLPRNRWRLGRVEKLVVGRDGHCRGARLATSSKAGQRTSCSRPLQRLVPLIQPISESKESCARNESVGGNEFSLGNTRSKRKAAIGGQELRHLREKFA